MQTKCTCIVCSPENAHLQTKKLYWKKLGARNHNSKFAAHTHLLYRHVLSGCRWRRYITSHPGGLRGCLCISEWGWASVRYLITETRRWHTRYCVRSLSAHQTDYRWSTTASTVRWRSNLLQQTLNFICTWLSDHMCHNTCTMIMWYTRKVNLSLI